MRKISSTLLLVVLALLSVGIVILASTSSVQGEANYGDAYYFLRRQLVWFVAALVAGFFAARLDYHNWKKHAVPLCSLSIILLILVFVPGVGAKVGGSYRWIRVAGVSFQPSELAKFASIVALSVWMLRVVQRAGKVKEGILIPLMGLAVVLCLIMLEPDFGTTLLIAVVGMAIMFVGGARFAHLVIAGVIGFCGFVVMIMQDKVRMGRILSFIMPDQYPDKAYHLMQSKEAFIGGGLSGVGLGNSIQKELYLPEAHTDFIFAIVGEELGFCATLLVILLFLLFMICGMIISFRASDVFGKLLAFGVTLMIVMQATINVAVVTGCVPTKGISLPFISYGGSSLVMSIAMTGVLLNIASQSRDGVLGRAARACKDRVLEL